MDSVAKKASHLARGLVTYADWGVFKILRVFEKQELPKDIKRILVVERLFFGDLIVITPVLRALKQRFPEAEIDVLVQPSMVDVLSGNPNISKVLPYSDDDLEDTRKVAQELSGKYGLGVILNYGTYRISKILKDARIPYRVGATKAGLLAGRGFFLTHKTKPVFGIKHKVEHHMDVVRAIGVDIDDKHLEVSIPASARESVKKFLSENKIEKSDLVVVIHAAPQHKTHCWFSERFAKVADGIIKKHGAKVVFSGAEKDRPLIEGIREYMENVSVNAAGRTSVKEYFALIDRADILISVDTSAMHVGSAVGTPVIALFGAGNPKMWKPYGEGHIVLYKDKEVCTGCLRHSCRFRGMECMKAITVEDVLGAAETILIRRVR